MVPLNRTIHFDPLGFPYVSFVFTSRKITFLNKLYTGIIQILQYKQVFIFVNIKIWNVTAIYN